MKKTLFFVALLFPLLCNAQIKVPVQSDTLAITSMQYHFDEIRPENWPFKYVIRNAVSFVFGDQEFKIICSDQLGREKYFWLEYDSDTMEKLTMTEKGNAIDLVFDGYALNCIDPNKPASRQYETSKNAFLEGRSVDKAGIRRPKYFNIMESGKVVVKIWVDRYGEVRKAVAGADGTTVTNQSIWKAAEKAAQETKFNMDITAPRLQEGTITYIFNLM